MVVIGPSDLSSIDTFPLVWRWTQVSHAVLSDEEIASIEPLRVEKARELQKLSRALEQNTALREVREINTDVLPEQDILTWLRHLPVIDDVVLVSWDEETGIRVPGRDRQHRRPRADDARFHGMGPRGSAGRPVGAALPR